MTHTGEVNVDYEKLTGSKSFNRSKNLYITQKKLMIIGLRIQHILILVI
jgi:hypothetical protein